MKHVEKYADWQENTGYTSIDPQCKLTKKPICVSEDSNSTVNFSITEKTTSTEDPH